MSRRGCAGTTCKFDVQAYEWNSGLAIFKFTSQASQALGERLLLRDIYCPEILQDKMVAVLGRAVGKATRLLLSTYLLLYYIFTGAPTPWRKYALI